jgi:hypothetical protein
VVIVKQYTFRAMIVIDPSVSEDAVQALLDGTRTNYVVQPSDGTCFPALICVGERSLGRAMEAVLRVRLLDEEAEIFFPAGQPFTVWVDAIAGDKAIRGHGLVGDGVILGPEPAAPPPGGAREAVPAQGRPPASQPPLSIGTWPAAGRQ